MSELKRRCDDLAGDGVSASVFERDGRRCLRVVIDGQAVYSLDVWLGGMGDATVSFYGGRGEMLSSSGSFNAWGNLEWDRNQGRSILRFNDLSLLAHVPGTGDRAFAVDEFIGAIWDRICDVIEEA